MLALCKSSHLEVVFETKRLCVICPLLPGRPRGLCSSPAVPRQQAACRSSLLTQGEPRDPQPPTGERCRVTLRAEGRSLPGCSETSFPFLSAVTDGIPEPSEGTVHMPLKLERMDGVDLVSQTPPGKWCPLSFALQRSPGCASGVASSAVS